LLDNLVNKVAGVLNLQGALSYARAVLLGGNSMKNFILASLVAFSAQAAILTTVDGEKTLENVKISVSGSTSVDRRVAELTTVAGAIRWKKVGPAKPKVYVVELLVDDASKFVASYEKIQESVNSMSTVALKMTFLRNVESASIAQSFQDALVNNEIDTTQPEYKTLYEALTAGTDFKKGTSFAVVIEKVSEENDVVTYQNADDQEVSITGKRGFFEGFLSIWLGNTTKDPGLDSAKKQLAGEPLK
jgi:hypothetical protein